MIRMWKDHFSQPPNYPWGKNEIKIQNGPVLIDVEHLYVYFELRTEGNEEILLFFFFSLSFIT